MSYFFVLSDTYVDAIPYRVNKFAVGFRMKLDTTTFRTPPLLWGAVTGTLIQTAAVTRIEESKNRLGSWGRHYRSLLGIFDIAIFLVFTEVRLGSTLVLVRSYLARSVTHLIWSLGSRMYWAGSRRYNPRQILGGRPWTTRFFKLFSRPTSQTKTFGSVTSSRYILLLFTMTS